MLLAAAAGVDPDRNREDDVVEAMTISLSDPSRARSAGPGHRRRIDTRSVVHTCIAYAETIDRAPSISELCPVAQVSERTLRDAFTGLYGVGPHRFFAIWTLGQARRRLLTADPSQDTVTRVAADLGIGHLGRFASRYRHIYREAPSETLARAS
jgi:AraC family ethanolamine operon transcriptional activator